MMKTYIALMCSLFFRTLSLILIAYAIPDCGDKQHFTPGIVEMFFAAVCWMGANLMEGEMGEDN